MTADHSCLTAAEMHVLLRWRRRVVMHWVIAMLVALAVWAIGGAYPVPAALEIAAAALLVIVTLLAARTMRRGVCPRCGGRIRFRPRIEFSSACPHCGVAFDCAPVTEDTER